VRQGLRVRQIIDGHDIDVLVALAGAEKVPADPSETVDCDSYSHDSLLFLSK
jgi:hypothetical protein